MPEHATNYPFFESRAGRIPIVDQHSKVGDAPIEKFYRHRWSRTSRPPAGRTPLSGSPAGRPCSHESVLQAPSTAADVPGRRVGGTICRRSQSGTRTSHRWARSDCPRSKPGDTSIYSHSRTLMLGAIVGRLEHIVQWRSGDDRLPRIGGNNVTWPWQPLKMLGTLDHTLQ